MSAVRSSGRTAGMAAILALLGVLPFVTTSRAQQAQIGIYNDLSRSSCSLSDAGGGQIRAYVMVNTSTGLTGVRFAAPKPDCFSAVWVGDELPDGLVSIGDSQTDISIATGHCDSGLRHVLTIVFQKTSTTTPCCLFQLQPAPGQATPIYTDCSFTEQSIAAHDAYVNGNETCPCSSPINQPPSAAFGAYPYPYQINLPVQLTLTWQATDPENDPLNYDVYFGTLPDPPLVASHVAQPSYNVTNLAYTTVYYWKIVVRDSQDAFATGPVWTFTTSAELGFPPTPVNPTPANGATGLLRTLQVKWQLAGGSGPVFDFEVHFGTTNQPAVVDTIPAAQNASYNVSGLALDTTYYWSVVSLGENGKRSPGAVWSFHTEVTNPPPNAPAFPVPPNNATGVAFDPTLQWTASDPEGQSLEYDVYLGTTQLPPLVTHTAQTSYGLANLSEFTRYYWQIVAIDSEGGSTLGPLWTFVTRGTGPPTTPVLVAPAAGSTISPHAVNLAWSSSDPETGALTYSIYLGTTTTPGLLKSGHTTSSYIVPGDLQQSATYYWKVIAFDTDGLSTEGPLWSFNTGVLVAPTVPSSPVPADGAINISRTVTLTWQCSDPDNQALHYTVLFNGTNYDRSTNSFTPPYNLAPSTHYSWRVTAYDTDQNSTQGPVWGFTTVGNLPPTAPVNIAPANNAIRQPLSLYLQWSATDPEAQPLKYDVYFGTSYYPPRVAYHLSDTSLLVNNLKPLTIYYWKVVAVDPDNNYATGDQWQFTTVDTPGPKLALGLYADASGTSCSLADKGAGLRSVYVILNGPETYTGVRFAATRPACFNATWISDSTPYVTVGNSQTDVSIGFGQCLAPPVNCMTITYMSNGDTQGCCNYALDSPVIIGKMLVTNCVFEELIPRSEPVLGISSNDACPACATNGYLTFAEAEDTCRVSGPHALTVDLKLDTASPTAAGDIDVVIDPDLTFVSCVRGPMIDDWGTFTYQLNQGVLTIHASGTAIPAGTTGTFARLTFTSNCCAWSSPAELGLAGATADFASLRLIGTHLGCNYAPNGDVNRDGNITVADAQCALETYLYAPYDPPSGCGGVGASQRADVDCSTTVTPADAYCIFRNWLDQSCSFCSGTAMLASSAGPAPRLTLRAVRENDEIVVVMHANGTGSIGALGFELKYPPALELVRVEPPRNDMFAALQTRLLQTGRVRVGAYANSGRELPASGDILAVRFRARSADAQGTVTALAFVDDFGGAVDVSVALESVASSTPPNQVVLHQNSPNPFNPRTMIRFELPEAMRVRLSVFDVRGRLVKELLDERRDAGASMVDWDGTDSQGRGVATGVYFYVLDAGGARYQHKMVMLK